MSSKKRVTYVLPAPPSNTPLLRLPDFPTPSSAVPTVLRSDKKPKKPSAQTHPTHCLPVLALAVDLNTVLEGHDSPKGILVSGGRDGLVASWELGLETEWRQGGWRVKDIESSPPPTRFRQCVQSHTDWITDLALCNLSRTVISSSNDRTVKAWFPHDPDNAMTPQIVGTHTDYVRCLGHSPEQGWVASGGFDKKLKLWDVQEWRKDPVVEITDNSPRGSIYSLAVNNAGSVIASGSPEKIVKVYDPRSTSTIASLAGHTDNVRSLLVSEDGRHVLSASSDSTVKLWSLAMQRVIHTFTYHSDSVWSLYSSHPNLEIFYSADRAGIVCKVDLQASSKVGDGECVVLLKDGDDADVDGVGINKIIALDDAYVWTATGTNEIRRWRDIKPREHRARQARQANLERSSKRQISDANSLENSNSTRTKSDAINEIELPSSQLFGLSSKLKPTSSEPHNSVSSPSKVKGPRSIFQQHHPSMSLQSNPPVDLEVEAFQIPLESLVSLAPTSDFDPFGAERTGGRSFALSTVIDSELATLYSSTTALSIPLHPTASSVEGSVAAHLLARQHYEEREIAAEAIPLRTDPDHIIHGSHGLMKVEMLNDRRHVLSVDTLGTVALWDIAHGKCIGIFDSEEVMGCSPLRRGSDGSSNSSINYFGPELASLAKERLNIVKERIEGESTTTTFCTVDCRTGRLSVHLEESRCFDAEVYADECDLDPTVLAEYKEDQRLIMGKWILRNLFRGFIEEELEIRKPSDAQDGDAAQSSSSSSRQRRPRHISLHNQNGNTKGFGTITPGMTIGLATPAPTPALPPDTRLVSSNKSISPRTQSMNIRGAPLTSIIQTPPNADTEVEGVEGSSTQLKDGSRDYFSYPVIPPSSPPPTKTLLAAEATPTTQKAALADGSTSPKPTSSQLPTQPQNPNNLSFMGRLKSFGGRKKQNQSETPSESSNVVIPEHADLNASPPDEYAHLSDEERKQVQMLNVVLSKPFEPFTVTDAAVTYDQDLSISIEEETSESGAWVVVYRGLTSSTKRDTPVLEMLSPQWLLEVLLGGRTHSKDPIKLSFILNPAEAPEDLALPPLPNGNTRLTANKVLRVKKVAAYIAEKLNLTKIRSRQGSLSMTNGGDIPELVKSNSVASMESLASNKEETVPAHELIELSCSGRILSPNMTLGSVKQFIFRQGADVVIFYRLKQPV